MDRALHTSWSMDGAACRTLGALARGHVWGVVVGLGEECAGQERPHLDELLLQAILGGQTNVATTLLELGANAQHVDEQGHDAVMWAATLTDQPELGMDTLLESGAPLGARNHEGMTALMLAAQKGHTHQVRRLLQYGARIQDQDLYGRSALMHAMGQGHSDTFLALVEGGADLMGQDLKGIAYWKTAIHEVQEEVLIHWLDRGGNPNACDQAGWSVLMLAAEAGMTRLVRGLLEQGADFNQTSMTGESPWDVATPETGQVMADWARAIERKRLLERRIAPKQENEAEPRRL